MFSLAGCGARTGLDVGSPDTGTPDVVRPPDAALPLGEPRIVFALLDGRGGARIHEVRPDGTGLRLLALPSARALYPAFTRDGLFMLYVALGATDQDPASIVVLDLRTRATRTLVTSPRLSSLAVSPDRRTVVYTADLDVRAIAWDGAGDRLLVRGPYETGSYRWGYGRPTFAGDSQTVFYSTAGRVERIGVDGTRRQTVLTEDLRRIVFPNTTASPDGARIAVGVACVEDRALRTYAVASLPTTCEAGELVTVIEHSEVGNQSNNPAWGDSGRIVYQQTRDLFVVDARGGTPRNVTTEITRALGAYASAAYPTWAPSGAALP